MMKQQYSYSGLALAMALTLTGCGSDDKKTETTAATPTPTPTAKTACTAADSSGVRTCTFDASTASVYLSLAAGDVATSTGEWDLAFQRFNVSSNGGSSGSGNRGVSLATEASQSALYDAKGLPIAAEFNKATADNTKALLTGTLTLPASTSAFAKDKVGSALQPTYKGMYPNALDYGWFKYYPTPAAASGDGLPAIAHSLGVNSSNGWLLKSGEGNSYARFRATAFTNTDGTKLGTMTATFHFDIQHAGDSGFTDMADWTPSASTGSVCYDFDTKTEVAGCTGTKWDLKITFGSRDATLSSNGGVSGSGMGKAIGPLAWTALSAYVSGTHDGTAVFPDVVYVTDSNSSFFSTTPWQAYNLNSDHRILPNYRVYLVNSNTTDVASKVYAVQIIGYYGGSSGTTSGHITLRYRVVR